jgi:S-DNA-T family DNA segregation ATPase FtsK/SpoIIIE
VTTVWRQPFALRLRGALEGLFGLAAILALATYNAADPSPDAAAGAAPTNLLGRFGATLADAAMQSVGLAAWLFALMVILAGLTQAAGPLDRSRRRQPRVLVGLLGVLALAAVLAAPAPPALWPLARGLGGFWGDAALRLAARGVDLIGLPAPRVFAAAAWALVAVCALVFAFGLRAADFHDAVAWLKALAAPRPPRPEPPAAAARALKKAARPAPVALKLPREDEAEDAPAAPAPLARAPAAGGDEHEDEDAPFGPAGAAPRVKAATRQLKPGTREARESQGAFAFEPQAGFRLPELSILRKAEARASAVDEEALLQNARLLESVLAEFGVNGRIDQIRPGPVVTLYELVPAPGVKTARVVALSDDIARSMSVVSCRVSVASGRNAIGIELPNAKREMVSLRDMLASADFEKSSHVLPMALGETIGGEPYIADLARMPHLLIAGTTGSGKSVGVNSMILSLLYRLTPDQCRMIMVDPKMLELSVYDGIPHLLAPVVTDPKKAIVALKWTVREMEDRYRRMSKIGVRNIAGYNERAREAAAKGEHFVRTVQTGFDETNRPVYEEERLDPEPMPYLVVVIDEVADLMMVAGKDIEGAVQRLAQMARAAGIHLIMATQRPSVDVITGTIKANFPTRISFQVTSKIDARTILGEQGAEQLLGQGDMLYMAGGGRVTRLHGPFVSDGEVEAVASFLRQQGQPQYLEEVTAAPDEDEGGEGGFGGGEGEGEDLYDRAVAVVTRDGKASTSYIQRRLQIGYNRAASLIERMEQEGVVGPANHAGKREILARPPP